MQVLKLTKKTQNKIQMIETMFSIYCLMADIRISQTEVTILAYLAAYGFKRSTKQLIIRSKILNSSNSLENTISKLRKMGLINKDEDNISSLIPQLNFKIDGQMGIIIKLENV